MSKDVRNALEIRDTRRRLILLWNREVENDHMQYFRIGSPLNLDLHHGLEYTALGKATLNDDAATALSHTQSLNLRCSSI